MSVHEATGHYRIDDSKQAAPQGQFATGHGVTG